MIRAVWLNMGMVRIDAESHGAGEGLILPYRLAVRSIPLGGTRIERHAIKADTEVLPHFEFGDLPGKTGTGCYGIGITLRGDTVRIATIGKSADRVTGDTVGLDDAAAVLN